MQPLTVQPIMITQLVPYQDIASIPQGALIPPVRLLRLLSSKALTRQSAWHGLFMNYLNCLDSHNLRKP